jgi:hypothetical protein
MQLPTTKTHGNIIVLFNILSFYVLLNCTIFYKLWCSSFILATEISLLRTATTRLRSVLHRVSIIF